jgi:hypothetical protein
MMHRHINDVSVTALFATDGEIRYRYRLEIARYNVTGKTVCVVMQNPSYASEEVADKSVQFMEKVVFEKGLAEFCGVSRLIVVNQFARIQTNGFRGLPEEVGSQNDAAIREALVESDIVIIGWGSSNRFEERKAYVLGLLQDMPRKLVLKTRMHPSRGRYEGFIQPFP